MEEIAIKGHLITHKDCLDGATAALVGWASGLDPLFVEPDRALTALEQLAAKDDVLPIYLADVSIPKESYSHWAPALGGILDHHATALPLAAENRVTIDLGRSGSHLFYDYAVHQGWLAPSKAWDRLVAMVEAYDLWMPRHDPGQNLERLFRARGLSWYHQRFAQGWVPLVASEAEDLARLVREEQAFLQKSLARIRHLTAGRWEIAGLLMDEDGSTNEVSHRLLQQGYSLVLIAKPDGRLSARSDQQIDASQMMAKLFRGGGHRRAAGGRRPADVPFDESGLNRLLDQIKEYLEPDSSPS